MAFHRSPRPSAARRSFVPALALTGLFAALSGAVGCATYSDDLRRGVEYYNNHEHERTLAVFRALEADVDSLKPDDRVRYYYYRGMTDYRLITEKYDVSADARHWLGLAKAGETETPSSLTEKELSMLNESLERLNRKIYGIGEGDEGESKKKGDEGESKKKGDEGESKKKGDDKPRKKTDD